jgi:hypothetical protein
MGSIERWHIGCLCTMHGAPGAGTPRRATVKNEFDTRPQHDSTPKSEPPAISPPDNHRCLRVRTAIRAGAGMVCPLGECS